MSDRAIDVNFEIVDDEQQVREFIAIYQGSSPARRTAAYRSDIGLVGRSQAFLDVLKEVERLTNTAVPVLLTGEPGTGKELIAEAIHQHSGRGDKPFVGVKSNANPPDLRGLWEAADGGTVYFDQLTETTPSLQEQLLNALQQNMNVRVIAASDRSMDHEVGSVQFAPDLLQRFSTVSLPPLRQRSEDIPMLAQSFADRVYSLNPPVKFSPEALALLERYSWPGNIRELESAVVRAVAMCDGTIRVKDLPERVRNYSQSVAATNGQSTDTSQDEWVPLSTIEGRYVAQVLEHTRGNKQAAARVLAVDRKTLDRMIKRHHIDSEKVRRANR
jgi:DNA-binding NtrC family response regulator